MAIAILCTRVLVVSVPSASVYNGDVFIKINRASFDGHLHRRMYARRASGFERR